VQVRVSNGCGREEESSREVGEANLVFFYCFSCCLFDDGMGKACMCRGS